jgi:hypothetical protein
MFLKVQVKYPMFLTFRIYISSGYSVLRVDVNTQKKIYIIDDLVFAADFLIGSDAVFAADFCIGSDAIFVFFLKLINLRSWGGGVKPVLDRPNQR